MSDPAVYTLPVPHHATASATGLDAAVLKELASEADALQFALGSADGTVNETQLQLGPNREDLRKRAAAQRERGANQLARRTEGTASMIFPMNLRERTSASLLTRFLSAINSTLLQMQKRGAQLLGQDISQMAHQEVNLRITRIDEVLVTVTGQYTPLFEGLTDIITPDYAGKAYSGELQMTTPTSFKIAQLFFRFDDALVLTEKAFWNGLAQPDDKANLETQFRLIYLELVNELVKVNRLMRNAVGASQLPVTPTTAPAIPALFRQKT